MVTVVHSLKSKMGVPLGALEIADANLTCTSSTGPEEWGGIPNPIPDRV